jgi:hypothetical protein
MRPPTGAVILKKGFFCVLTPRSNIHVMHPARSGCYRNSGLVGNVAPWAPAEVTTAVLEQHDAVLGRQVRSIAGEDMGRVVNVVVDQSGQVRAAIIDFGGFLGVGNRKIAVDWNALHFATTATKDDQITLDLTRDQVKAAPEYKEGRPLVVIGTTESLPPSYPASK